MKKLSIVGLVLASSAAYAAGPVVSDNASQKACFGQARAATIHVISGKVWGEIAAMRAEQNAELNAAYRDACQG